MHAIQNRLIEEFSDSAYAHAYMGSHTVSTISAQVYWTRKSRGWTQAELAERAGMAQERISKIEAGDFTSLTMKTLSKLAEALDVNLRVEFEPFAHGVHSVCNQTKEKLQLADRMSSLNQLKNSFVVVSDMYGGGPVSIVTTGTSSNTITKTRWAAAPVMMQPQAELQVAT